MAAQLTGSNGVTVQLDDEAEARFVASFQPGFNPTPEGRQMNVYLFVLWLVILGTLAGAILLFGYWAYESRADEKTAAFLMAPATTALGAIVGLLAPSPTK